MISIKQNKIEKTMDSAEITPQQLSAIGHYTRREIKPEDLFVFSVILCDNEIDRDFERFDDDALEKLSTLYLGKTGVFDHMAKAENQSARIFDTTVVETDKTNSLNVPYKYLRGWAYMVRCNKTEDLILEIDAGIKKEVSVGCAVENILCSICGNEQKRSACSHDKGKNYSGVDCYYTLNNPTDAYEWSFVAVPAQKNAGVTKYFSSSSSSVPDFLEKKLDRESDSAVFSGTELNMLQHYITQLKTLASAGEDYMEDLQKSIVRNASFAQPEMDLCLLEDICKNLDASQLKTMNNTYAKMLDNKTTVTLQTVPPNYDHDLSTEFKI